MWCSIHHLLVNLRCCEVFLEFPFSVSEMTIRLVGVLDNQWLWKFMIKLPNEFWTQLRQLINWANELYSPTIRIVGTRISVSPGFAIDKTLGLGRGSKKQRCERGYDVIRWTRPRNHPKQLLLPTGGNLIIRSISHFLLADMVSSYNWLTRCM